MGSSKKNNKDIEEYSKTDANLSIDSRESSNWDITLSNLVLAMDTEVYSEWLREISIILKMLGAQ